MARYMARTLFALSLTFLLLAGQQAGPAGPSHVDPAYLRLLEWRSIGPSRGGRSLAVAGDPKNKLVFYFGATGGGVWKTEDGGLNWRNVSDGYFSTGAVGAVAVAQADPNVVYVGMGEACVRGDVSHGDGVYKSTDAGKTWARAGLERTRHIARIRIHPGDPNTVYVAALGDPFGPSPDRGVFRSRDGGKTWEKILFRDERTGAIDLTMDPGNPATLYAAFLEIRRFPWALRSAGPGSGIFKTTDGGDHWTEITNRPGLPSGLKGRIGIALSPARPNRVWAIIDAGTGKKGVFRTDDGGATWQRVSDNANLTQRPWYYHHIFADPKDADTVYVLNIQMWKSTDGGKTYAQVRPPHGDHHDLWIDPADPRRMIEANDGGGTISYNGGLSWSTVYNQPTAQMYHVTTDNQFPYRVYGAQQDNSTLSIPSRSDFGAITAEEWYTVAGGESGYIAVHSKDPNIVYGGDHHWVQRYDHRNHQTRDISPWPETHYGWGDRDINHRFQWTFPVALSPHDPGVLYATAQHVFKTTDEGQTWQIISPDLTRHDASRLEPTPRYGHEKPGEYWGPITRDNTGAEWYSTIFAFAESPVKPGVLWAGSDDGYVQVSQDGGKNWANVTPKDLPEFALISILDPSPHDPAAAYLAATRYKVQDRHPYLYKTGDYGKTWTRITHGIPDSDFTRVIREDPGRRGLLYAGTETGIYVSFDDGANWQSLRPAARESGAPRMNLPVVPVHDLVVKTWSAGPTRGTGEDLVVATHGRGFWILDNVALLQQFHEQALSEPVHLFKPAPAVRFRAGASLATRGEGGEGPRDIDGKNPPQGAVIQYFLKQQPEGEVRLEILDAQGRAIRSFSSAAPPLSGAGRRVLPGISRLAAEAGPHRFVWDMRYPAANIIPETTLHAAPEGPLAAPGRYQAKLVVDGRSYTQSFEIVKDPRIAYTDRDLAEQHDFLIAARDKLAETHDTVGKIRDLRRQMEEAIKKVQGTPRAESLAEVARAVNNKVYPIEERLSQYRARATQDLTNYPAGIDDKLVVLARFAARADAPPTEPQRNLLKDLSTRLAKYKAEIDEVVRADWTVFEKASSQ